MPHWGGRDPCGSESQGRLWQTEPLFRAGSNIHMKSCMLYDRDGWDNHHGHSNMNMVRALAVIALGFGFAACLSAAAALARPPTVTVSPGYDARLAESRQKLWASQYYGQNYYIATRPQAVRKVRKPPRSRPMR